MAKLSVELVRRNFPEVRESWGKNGEEFNVHCPFPHEKGGVYKLYINSDTGMYYCQDCGRRGNAWKEFFEYAVARRYGNLEVLRESQSRRPAVEQRSHRQFYAGRGRAIRWGSREIVAPGETVGLETLPEDHPAREYLRDIRKPGYDERETCDPEHPFHCLYCTKGQVEVLAGQCRAEGRIIFPITHRRDVIGWTARRIEKPDPNRPDIKWNWNGTEWEEVKRVMGGKWADHLIPKWFHLPSMAKSTVLFNYDAARDFEAVLLLEGPLDVYRGGEFSVGYLGRIPSEVQIRMIKNEWETVFWMPDADVDRESRAVRRVVESLSDCCRVVLLDVPEGAGDPGASSRERINESIKSYL